MSDENLSTQKNIKLIVSYDGTDFSGWQRQPKMRTVQSEIENALQKMHNKYVPLYAAGRTDTGVHAAAQCANFLSDIKNIKAQNFIPALNSILPRDVRIVSAAETDINFHSRFSAKTRSYRYYIICGRQAHPAELRYAMQIWNVPDINLLNSYARLLHGEIDCSLFASSRDSIFLQGSGSKFRYIYSASFFMENGKLVFEISANAFFRKMVRSIIGTLIFYESRKATQSEFKEILKKGSRENAGPTAITNGLFLWNVGYQNK
jgi:tRNA pseudouridine38-40 synthase